MPSRNNSGRLSKQREIEINKRKKRKIKLIIFLILVVFIGIIVFLLKFDKFALANVKISGNVQLTNEQVLEQSELEIGKSIFSYFNIVTKVRLKQNGYIKDAKVSKEFPNTIKIEINERQKAFQIKTENGYYIYIDEQGYIIDCSQTEEDLITIIGMDITEENIDGKKRLEEEDLSVKMENILHIKQETTELDIFDKITEVQVEDEYIIKLENDGITINLGDCTNIKSKMDYVKIILEKEAGNRGTIYVNGNLNEGFSPYFSAE